jgi:hypothetical protein
LITIDLGDLYPIGSRYVLDIKDQLFQGLILREKDFREFVKQHNWQQYQDTYVTVHCSTDAVIPDWAWMLLAVALEPYARKIVFGDLEKMETVIYDELLNRFDFSIYKDARVVVKGCGDKPVPLSAYIELTRRLRPIAKSIMYGEPCSTVPLYKQPKTKSD